MKHKTETISAIWNSNEKQSVEECSKRILDFLRVLKKHNPVTFSKWYEKGKSKNDALKKQAEFELDFFIAHLKNKWDKKFDDLGARVSFWTGSENEDKAAGISFNIGAYGNEPYNKNSCVITLPKKEDFYNSLENVEQLIDLLRNHWNPDKLLINGEPL